jgi:hypothetical protein
MNKRILDLYNWWAILLAITVFSMLYLFLLYPWMNRWGVSESESVMALPGDGAVEVLVITSTRGVTIHASAEEVWKWVVQLGQERAGFYSNDWLENLTFTDIHNANEIRPEWQHRYLGDKVLGAGGPIYGESSFWNVRVYEEGRAIYLWGSIVVLPIDPQTSRLLVRTYAPPPASPVMQTVAAFTYDWMHFVMERGMLLGIKARAEGTLDSGMLLRGFSNLGWMLSTVGMGYALFSRSRGWWWGLLPLGYAVSILVITKDSWSAMAGFLWWGIITAGFLLWGRAWWKGLLLSALAVILVFVIADQPHTTFGILFLLIEMSLLVLIRPLQRPAVALSPET